MLICRACVCVACAHHRSSSSPAKLSSCRAAAAACSACCRAGRPLQAPPARVRLRRRLLCGDRCLRRLRLSDQRLTHQADDQPVALDGAHALLQLEQDGVLVSGVAALRLPIVGMSAAQGPGRRLTCSHRGAVKVASAPAARPPSTALIESKEAGVTSAVSKAPCSVVLITMSNSAPLACACHFVSVFLTTTHRLVLTC